MPFFEGDVTSSMEESGIQNPEELMEHMLAQEVAMMTEDTRTAYLASEEFKVIEESGVLGKKTIVRLTKMDDLTRRIKIAALQKAKEKGDADWTALRKNRIMERKLIARIMQRHGNQVKRDAIIAQRSLLKITPNAFTRPIGR